MTKGELLKYLAPYDDDTVIEMSSFEGFGGIQWYYKVVDKYEHQNKDGTFFVLLELK